jgi:hypothetical protein
MWLKQKTHHLVGFFYLNDLKEAKCW